MPITDFLSKLSDRIFGEKPPSATEITSMISKNITPVATSASSVDMESIMDEVKREVNKKAIEIDSMTAELNKVVAETKDMTAHNTERIEAIESNMQKFLSLYELVTNQVNPFIEQIRPPSEKNDSAIKKDQDELEAILTKRGEPDEKRILSVVTTSAPGVSFQEVEKKKKGNELQTFFDTHREKELFLDDINRGANPNSPPIVPDLTDADLDTSSKEAEKTADDFWSKVQEPSAKPAETPEIKKDAKGKADGADGEEKPAKDDSSKTVIDELKNLLPLKAINNDLYSLVTTLNWIRYLIDNMGSQGASELLRTYRELGWITPEVHTVLMRYIKTIPEEEIDAYLSRKDHGIKIEDHMNSLFFISKLKGVHMEKEDFDEIVKKFNIAEMGGVI